MDFITLWISAVITSKRRSALRLSLGSAFGALYGVLSLLFIKGTALTYISFGAVSIIMCLIAFGKCAGLLSLLKQSLLIWGCGALLGGIMTGILSISTYNTAQSSGGAGLSLLLSVSVVAAYVIARIISRASVKREVTVVASWKGRQVSFSALCDSGNLLCDPISGTPVIPVSHKTVEKLIGKSATKALMTLDTDTLALANIGLRVIPHKSIDRKGSLMGGFIPDRVTVTANKKKNEVKCILAPKKCETTYFAGCSATVPSSILP